MKILGRLMTTAARLLVTSAILLSVAHALSFSPAQESNARPAARARPATRQAAWVTAWGTSQQALGDTPITNATVRMIARITIPGDSVRIRLDNTFGTEPVAIGHAYIGHRVQGAALAAGSNRPLTFNGSSEVAVPAGGSTWSDPVRLSVLAQQDLAVSLYIPGSSMRPSQHTGAVATSYRSADGSGDVTSEEGRAPFGSTTTSLWWLKAIDVESVSSPGAIVAFGDSITDGTCSTLDAHDRWEDVLSVRLGLEHDANARRARGLGEGLKAVVNEGIGGNTITREADAAGRQYSRNGTARSRCALPSRRDGRPPVHGDERYSARGNRRPGDCWHDVDRSKGESQRDPGHRSDDYSSSQCGAHRHQHGGTRTRPGSRTR